MSIIFDLDGTLIDSKERLYKLFIKLIPECDLTKEQYWEYKRNKINHKILLKKLYPSHQFEDFNKKWMSLIETEYYLSMDQCYSDTIEILKQLNRRKELILLTARQSKSALFKELKVLGLINYFSEILTTEGNYTKEELLFNSIRKFPKLKGKENYFISDMGKDIQLGNEMSYHTIAITHGFMNKENLQKYRPEKIVNNLTELLDLIDE